MAPSDPRRAHGRFNGPSRRLGYHCDRSRVLGHTASVGTAHAAETCHSSASAATGTTARNRHQRLPRPSLNSLSLRARTRYIYKRLWPPNWLRAGPEEQRSITVGHHRRGVRRGDDGVVFGRRAIHSQQVVGSTAQGVARGTDSAGYRLQRARNRPVPRTQLKCVIHRPHPLPALPVQIAISGCRDPTEIA